MRLVEFKGQYSALMQALKVSWRQLLIYGGCKISLELRRSHA
jgi:hypothetical protein